MLAMAVTAAQPGLRVRTAIELRVSARVAAEANRTLLRRRFVTKSNDVTGPAACTNVLAGVAVAVQAPWGLPCPISPGRRIQHDMRIRRQHLELVAMTASAECLGKLRIQSLRVRTTR